MSNRKAPPRAFTLIELLVVMSIIALLIAILVPAVALVRNSAKNAQAVSQQQAIDTGLELYRGEQSLGGAYPPSAGDDPTLPFQIADPGGVAATSTIFAAGAHLLVQGLLGADLLGPPGFVDLDRDGMWADDTHKGVGGVYELDPDTADALHSRYPDAGGYVSEKMKSQVTTMGDLVDDGTAVAWDATYSTTASAGLFVFVDPWGLPVLYYRTNRAARNMTTAPGAPGIYTQEDNAIITGSESAALTSLGADFGSGLDDHGDTAHALHGAIPVPLPITLDADGQNDILSLATFDRSFARYILDTKARGRNQPVRKNSYILISAGPDAIYGTTDDVTNFTRKRE